MITLPHLFPCKCISLPRIPFVPCNEGAPPKTQRSWEVLGLNTNQKKKNNKAPKNTDPACLIGPAADRRQQQRSNKLVAVYQMGRGDGTINLAPVNVDLSSLLIVWKVDPESNSNFSAGPGQCLFPMEQLVHCAA